jgi:hypothetical protein
LNVTTAGYRIVLGLDRSNEIVRAHHAPAVER